MRKLWHVLGWYEDTCNIILDHHQKFHEIDFPIHIVVSFLQWKLFLPKSVFFAFCFLPDAFYINVEPKLMMPEAVNDVCMPSPCFHERIFSSKFVNNISLVGMSWRYKFIGWYKNIALKMSLSPAKKSGNSFNFYLQKSIAWWEPALSPLFYKYAMNEEIY